MFDRLKSVFSKKNSSAKMPDMSTARYLEHLSQTTFTEKDLKDFKQAWSPKLSATEIATRFERLEPKVPWCHFYELGVDFYTVRPNQPKNFSKAKALKSIAELLKISLPYICKKQNISDLTVLDLACAEGAHAIELANAGAKKVVGVEGRQLYVDRAKFIADCAGLQNVQFLQQDVRYVSEKEIGTFDLVLFFGILHHLSENDFLPMLKRLYELTADTLIIHTHTSEPGWESRFLLSDEIENKDGARGRLYREHPDGASDKVKEARRRNSLDNTFSFWAREASLLKFLKLVGFTYIAKQLHPSPFDEPSSEFRVFYICRK